MSASERGLVDMFLPVSQVVAEPRDSVRTRRPIG